MEIIKVGLLMGYGILRLFPFIITIFFLHGISVEDKVKGKNSRKLYMVLFMILGIGINAIAFIGMHYYHYKDIKIIGYIKNIWGLNFYHQDVEYFLFSVFLLLILGVVIGILLRFAGECIVFNCLKGLSFEPKQEYFILLCGSIAVANLLLGFYAKDYFQTKIKLYEIAGNDQEIKIDEELQGYDYIELINTGILPCHIEDLFLSDDFFELKKISLQGEIIPAKGILLVPCIEEANSFKIDKNGETIYLSDGNNRVLEKVVLKEMETGTAYVKRNYSSEEWEISKCSPGVHNNLEEGNHVEMPILSHASGFYTTDFELNILAEEDTNIYYTLDGSIPDENSYIYEQAIEVYDKSSEPNTWRSVQNVVLDWNNYIPIDEPVDKAFIVRAIAMDKYGNKSDEVTATYYIDKEEYKDKNVLSIIADPEDLFGNESGIYVTGEEYDEWYLSGQEGEEPIPNFKKKKLEKEAIIELFDESGSILHQNVGIRIQGASARERKDKRFSVFARKEYGDSETLDIVLFDRDTQPHSFVIREGLEDVICHRLMENRDIPIMRGEEICLFLNGEYWYDNRYMREKYSEQYFEDNYGILEDNIIVYKGGEIDRGVETDQILHDNLFEYVQGRDFSSEREYELFCKLIDIQNYIDYLVVNIYCANMDVDDNKNVVMWRSREVSDDKYADGKMRWALYDMDAMEWNDLDYYNVKDGAEIDSFSQKPKYAKCAYNEGTIYVALKQNEEFCKNFVLTFMDLMNENFTVENVNNLLKDYGADARGILSFFEKRPIYMKNYLAKEFELLGTIEPVIIRNIYEEGGCIKVNSITPQMSNGSWAGEYFTDYPITLSAEPKQGYEFAGWSGDIISDEQVIEISVPADGLDITADFKKIN